MGYSKMYAKTKSEFVTKMIIFIYLFIIHVSYYLPSSTESAYLNKHIIFKIII